MYICIVCSQYMYVNSLCQIYVQYCTHIYKRQKKQRYFLLQQCSCLKRNFDVVEFFHWTLIWETNCCTQPTFPVMIAERKKWQDSTRSISESIKCSFEYSYICMYKYIYIYSDIPSLFTLKVMRPSLDRLDLHTASCSSLVMTVGDFLRPLAASEFDFSGKNDAQKHLTICVA